jgi:acyl-lipid omega-6 desaturase (Delta-12 desaturase)
MENVIKKSDFVLTPYMKSNDLWASYQVLNTIVPYILLWVVAAPAAATSLWLLVPIIVLMTLFSVRCFSLMHDCGHHSLFSSKRINRGIGFGLGLVNAIPQYPWSRGHAYHHKTNGDWDRYRGPSGLISTAEFACLSPAKQRFYALLRHPLMIIPGGFFYLAIKPRLALILGGVDFIGDFWNGIRQGKPLPAIVAHHKSKHWYTADEFWDLLFNNIGVVLVAIGMGSLMGYGLFFGIYAATLTGSAAIFICVFFVQHNFPGSYAHKTEGWEYLLGALQGSSYLQLPILLNWFTADIGYHNIHHLSSRIPNYNLKACHNANGHLLTQVTRLRISDIPGCFQFILWDRATDQLVSIATFKQSIGVISEISC